MAFFAVALTLRYTRISCMPFRASIDFDKTVQAKDSTDAVRQACLCLDRDLEDILSRVNAINVSEMIVEVKALREVSASTDPTLWNPKPFGPQLQVPPHLVVRPGDIVDAGGVT